TGQLEVVRGHHPTAEWPGAATPAGAKRHVLPALSFIPHPRRELLIGGQRFFFGSVSALVRCAACGSDDNGFGFVGAGTPPAGTVWREAEQPWIATCDQRSSAPRRRFVSAPSSCPVNQFPPMRRWLASSSRSQSENHGDRHGEQHGSDSRAACRTRGAALRSSPESISATTARSASVPKGSCIATRCRSRDSLRLTTGWPSLPPP